MIYLRLMIKSTLFQFDSQILTARDAGILTALEFFSIPLTANCDATPDYICQRGWPRPVPTGADYEQTTREDIHPCISLASGEERTKPNQNASVKRVAPSSRREPSIYSDGLLFKNRNCNSSDLNLDLTEIHRCYTPPCSIAHFGVGRAKQLPNDADSCRGNL